LSEKEKKNILYVTTYLLYVGRKNTMKVLCE